MIVTRKRVIQVAFITSFIVGAVLIGVGTSGAAMPLIIAGVILVMFSGAGGFMASMEQPSLRSFTPRSETAATS